MQSKEEDMNALLMNGNSNPADPRFDTYLQSLAQVLTVQGHGVNTLELRSMDLRQCSGCFGCWLKTPGVCATQDQHGQLLRAFLDADVVVLASPLVLGFSSGLLKRAADKLIPVLLPYIDASSGECRHYLRYSKAPRLAVLYQDEPDTADEDRAITREIWSRMARNANTSLIACLSTTMATTEVAHAIARA
jgi:multimeric flavodoxin WrbA